MKTAITFIVRRKDIKVRKSLPTAVVATRPHKDRKKYNRNANKQACES